MSELIDGLDGTESVGSHVDRLRAVPYGPHMTGTDTRSSLLSW